MEQGICPGLKRYPDIQEFDTIFLGFPNWWNTLPMPVVGFLKHYSWQGKRIIPFVTSGGGGFGQGLDDLRKLCPEATIDVENGEFLGHTVTESKSEITQWALDAVK